jgi:PAS domain S-box-containing protein
MVARLAIVLSPALLLSALRPPADAAEVQRATGVVVYSDPAWGRLFLHDGRRILDVAAEAIPRLPGPRRQVEVDGPLVRDLGPASLPEATPLAALPAEEDGLQWVTLEGRVRAAVDELGTRALLRVATHGRLVDAHVPAPLPEGAPRAGARVRLVGVLEPPGDAWSRPRLWVGDWSEAVVTAPSPPWESVRRVTISEAHALASSVFEDEVRLVAPILAWRSQRSFKVGDGGDTISVPELANPDPVRDGRTLEIRGFPTIRHGESVIADARWRSIGPAASELSRHEDGLPTLTRVSQVRGLSRAEAERGYPVRLDAVATYVSRTIGHLFVQDETGGLYVNGGGRDSGVAAGDRVRVIGFTAPGGLAAMVTGPTVHRLGPARLPEAMPVSSARLSAGYDDCRRVRVSGVVRGVAPDDEGALLLLGFEGQRVPVHLPPSAKEGGLPPVDARVSISGVCGTHFNRRGLFDRVELFVASASDVAIEERPAPPFTLPVVPAGDLLRSGTGGRWDRLVRTRAVVLHHGEGQPLYLRGSAGTVIAETDSAQPLVPGDEVDVVGFPAPTPSTPRLEDSFFRVVAHGPPPEPVALGGAGVLGPALDAELARFQATLVEVVQTDTGTSLILQGADQVIEALGEGELRPRPPDGSRLEVTGILLADERSGSPHARLLLRGPRDVRLVARPPWLTPRRAALMAGALAAAALVALAWVLTLRRRVRARTSELWAAEERYRLLADNASDVILTTDEALRLTYVSPSVVHDLGYTPEEALALPLERIVAPESWELLRSALARAGDTPGQADLELEVLRKDGASRWMHVRTSALRSAAGERTGFLAAARDVTARRSAQRELARLAAAIEQSVDTVVLTDPAGVILYVNPAFERTTGYAAAEVLGRKPAVWKSGVHDRPFYDALWATLRAGRTWEGRFTNRRRDGQLFLEDASISPVVDRREGRLIGFVAVKRDVTRQVQLEGQVAQAQKMEALGRLAAGIAHDFNNVLAIVLSLADLALQPGRSPERIGSYLGGIREAVLRASGLTRQILTFSRQSPAQMQEIDPKQVVAEAVRMLRLLLPPGVQVRERLESTARLTADATQLQQIVVNLGTNAGLAMRDKGGTVEIGLEDALVDEAFAESHPPLRAGACLRLVVSDRGCGMSHATIARIFEPFFSTRASRDGTGMGLAVVHGVVHGHGGTITVMSEEGRGSTFCVYLPALPPRAGSVAALALSAGPGHGPVG